MTNWIILRCSGRDTLKLSDSLAEDGLETWAPVVIEKRTVPRMNAKREVRLPMMAGFVFAKAEHLYDLLEMERMPVKKRRGKGLSKPAHAGFTVFHFNDGIPLVADRELNALRRIARRRTVAPKSAPLKRYQQVKALEGSGAYQGMSGRVEQSNERETVVCFGGGLLGTVKLATCLLKLEMIGSRDEPARKAA